MAAAAIAAIIFCSMHRLGVGRRMVVWAALHGCRRAVVVRGVWRLHGLRLGLSGTGPLLAMAACWRSDLR